MVTISRLTTLLSFVIALAGLLPVWPWLELFPRLAASVGLLSGVLQEVRGRWRFKSWQAYLVLVLLSLWYIAQYSRSNPVLPVSLRVLSAGTWGATIMSWEGIIWSVRNRPMSG